MLVAGFIAIIIHVGCWFYRNNYSCWLLLNRENNSQQYPILAIYYETL
jgi:hypothetical protein